MFAVLRANLMVSDDDSEWCLRDLVGDIARDRRTGGVDAARDGRLP